MTVKPKRAPVGSIAADPSDRRLRASIRHEGTDARTPPRTARNSARTLRVVGREMARVLREMRLRGPSASSHADAAQWRQRGLETRLKDACGPWRGDAREPSGHLPFPYAYGSHGGACARGGLVDMCVSRSSPTSSRPATPIGTRAKIVIFPCLKSKCEPKSMARPDLNAARSCRLIGSAMCQVNGVQCFCGSRTGCLQSTHTDADGRPRCDFRV